MTLIGLLYILTAVITTAFAVRVAYVIKDDKRRKRVLGKHKTRNGQQAYDMYSRMYTRRFLLASSLVSGSWVLSVIKNVIEVTVGHVLLVTFITGILALTIGLTGAILASQILRGE